jgi:chromatin remodeling complex protein RSC6
MSSNTSSDNSNKMSTAAKSSSKKAAKTESAPVAAVAAAAPAVAAPAKEAKVKAPKAAKAEVAAPAPAVAAAAPASTPVAAAAPVAAVEEDVSAQLTASIAQLHEQLSGLKAAFSTAAATLKTIEKQAARVVKKAERRRKRKSTDAKTGEPKACIFTKPVKISEELCSFLGKPKGTEISRSEVTKAVMAYAYAHTLMDKQQIKADAALRKLLTVSETDKVTILNLQKYLNRHYVKPAPVAA